MFFSNMDVINLVDDEVDDRDVIDLVDDDAGPPAVAQSFRSAARAPQQRNEGSNPVAVNLLDDYDDNINDFGSRRKRKRSQRSSLSQRLQPHDLLGQTPWKTDPNDSDDEVKVVEQCRRQANRTVVVSDKVEVFDPLGRVLEVFPDADPDFVRQVIAQMTTANHSPEAYIPLIIAKMTESSYPKASLESNTKNKRGGLVHLDQSCKYDYTSQESFVPSMAYRQQAFDQLLFDFPFLSKQGV